MFTTIQEYYQYLENDKNILNDYNVSLSLNGAITKCDDPILKLQWTYELFFTDFKMELGGIRPHFTNNDGQEYPNYALFKDNLTYIKKRANDTLNTKYKAKYNHLLWESKQKHLDYAKEAIDGYFSFIQSVQFSFDDIKPNKAFEKYFENLFALALQANYRKEEILQNFTLMLGTKRVYGYAECALMGFIAENGKNIDKRFFEDFTNYANKVLDGNEYPEFVEDYLQLQIILCQKLNISPKVYQNKLGDFYVEKAEPRKESFAVHDTYIRALSCYQKAGNKDKIE